MRRVAQRTATETAEAEAWTRNEVAELLALAERHEPRFYPALFFPLSTGVRRGELLGLKWQDVNFDARRINIRRAITARQVTTPKNGKGRVVAMTEGLTEVLFNLLAERRREGLARGWPDIPEWVFCSDVGTAHEESNFSRVWYRLRCRAEKEGIRPLKPHAARRT